MFRKPAQTKIHVHGFKFDYASAEKIECVDPLVDAMSPYSWFLVPEITKNRFWFQKEPKTVFLVT